MTMEEKILDGISARLDRIESRQETIRTENRSDHEKIFGMIGKITEEGCPLGQKNSEYIKELRGRSYKLVELGSMAISALCAAIAVYFSRGH